MMNVAVWNVRGLNRRDHQVAVNDLVSEFMLHLVGLLEFRVNSLHETIFITVAYGATDVGTRCELWQVLGVLARHCVDDLWLVRGDFNAVLDLSEVCGMSGDIRLAMEEFNDYIVDTRLITLPMQGELFTWHNCSLDNKSLWKRLDQLLVNDRWLQRSPNIFYFDCGQRYIVIEEDSLALLEPVTSSKVKLALFDTAEDKSPGPDGFSS
ncbi:UNVERIFIED_CONTAM: hypothetical protein Sradi_4540000 [Sesamum radiatum]|uniref:Endonuclease/exonuclease/phosphatase domain-containing protein n=1 Tax=Sesamum radiatum TaxID=300843 RepID=A0AAW2N8B4_SESRA